MQSWVPIISSSSQLGKLATAAISAIVADIENSVGSSRRPHNAYEESLLFAYLGLDNPQGRFFEMALDRINREIETASKRPNSLGLFSGISGLGWCVEHLCQILTKAQYSASIQSSGETTALPPDEEDFDEEDFTADIEGALLAKLAGVRLWNDHYDLISGLVGFGVYFLERYPRPGAVRGLCLVLEHLENLAIEDEDGVTWVTRPHLIPSWQLEYCPNGYFNLGVAHGIPGILYLLNEMMVLGVESTRCKKLLIGGVSWILAKQRPSESLSRYGSWIPVQPAKSREAGERLAWCYGDLGISAVLQRLVKSTGLPMLREASNKLIETCLSYQPERAGVVDAEFCHGAVGVAHIFNRLFQSTSDLRCRDAALVWYQQTLDMRKPGEGLGGFRTLTSTKPGDPTSWEASPAFLDGAIGIGLALQAALSPVEPAWDRQLCLSGRDRLLLGKP